MLRAGATLAVLAIGAAVATPSAAATHPRNTSGLAQAAGGWAKLRAPGAHTTNADAATPPTLDQCKQKLDRPCYDAKALEHAYGIDKLRDKGIDGSGTTVALLTRYAAPYVQSDMDTFTKGSGLPATNIKVIKHGDVPPSDPSNAGQVSDNEELALDSQMIHAAAPGAHIVVVETGPDTDKNGGGQGNQMEAAGWVATHENVDVISMSFGYAEDDYATLAGKQGDYHLLDNLRSGLKTAAGKHVTLVASNGDDGATAPKGDSDSYYDKTEAQWSASDPLVTAVGGTELHLTAAGDRTGADTVWNDTSMGAGATGGAPSRVFSRPSWQPQEKGIGDHRASTDVAMNAAHNSSGLIFHKDNPAGNINDWSPLAGTSMAAPLFAGVVADAAGLRGAPLGDIHSTLYQMKPGTSTGLADVTQGCNTAHGVTGFCAASGPDPVSGVGTISDASVFVHSLAGK